MKHFVVIRPEAESDLRVTFQWYEEQVPGLGIEFLRCVDASMALIIRSPEISPTVYKQIRRKFIRRFPYGIFYFLDNNKIIVIAVMHARRDPKYWQKREKNG